MSLCYVMSYELKVIKIENKLILKPLVYKRKKIAVINMNKYFVIREL